jgi:hypothetical protein
VAENVAQTCRGLERRPGLLDLQRARHFAFETTAQTDQPFCMLGEQFLIDARAVVKAFRISRRDQLDQVLVAFVRLGQQYQMIRFSLWTALLEPAALRNVDLAAKDRLQTPLAGVIVEDD